MKDPSMNAKLQIVECLSFSTYAFIIDVFNVFHVANM